MGDRFGTVSINGRPYRIDLQTYRARDVTDFAPRASTPGGGIIFSELDLYQPLNQTDWRHGFGFAWNTDSSGFYDSYQMDTRHAGIAMPFTIPYTLENAAAMDASQFITVLDISGKDLILSYGPGGISATSEAAFGSNVAAGNGVNLQLLGPTGVAVNTMWTNGTYIFLCLYDLRIVRSALANIDAGLATSGGASSLVDTTKTWTDDKYNGYYVTILRGTGKGQTRVVADTVASTKTITTTVAWTTAPDSTSYYMLYLWEFAGIDANAKDYAWMQAHDGFVFAGRRNTNYVYFDSTEDLHDLHGTVASDPTAIQVGVIGRPVLRACSYNGDLFFARIDGLYKMDKDRSAARKVLDYSDQLHPNNFLGMTVFNGNLVFPISNQLYQWNGVRVTPITPPRMGDTFPYRQYSRFRNFIVFGNWLLCIAKNNIFDGGDDLIAFDGVGWHLLERFTRSTTGDAVLGSSLVITRAGTAATGSTGIWITYSPDGNASSIRTKLVSLSTSDEFPYPNFSTTVDSVFYTSRLDAGFRRIIKSTPSILVEVSNLVDEGSVTTITKYIDVYYRLNSVGTVNGYGELIGTWTPWGGREGVSNRIIYNGITELNDPLGRGTSSTIEYFWMELKFVFHSTATSCPVLEGYTVRLIMRPDTDYGFSFNIYASEEVEYAASRTDSRGPKAMIDDLRLARDSKAPILYVDPFDVAHRSYVTSVTELAVEEHVNDLGPDRNIEHVVQINLVDVGLGVSTHPSRDPDTGHNDNYLGGLGQN